MSAQTTSSTNFSTDVKILKRAVAVQLGKLLIMGGRDTNVLGEITQSLHAGHRAQPSPRDWCY